MVNINIKIPDELHKKLKLEAIQSDTTLKQLIIQKIKEKTKGR